jgi:signal recognition particle subunit SRP68
MGVQASGSASAPVVAGTRDLQFVHAYILYQLLSRRLERDQLLAAALLSSQPTEAKPGLKPTTTPTAKTPVDARLYPAVVKLLDSTLQSLEQLRALSIVDESPELAGALEARVAYTKARRCVIFSVLA